MPDEYGSLGTGFGNGAWLFPPNNFLPQAADPFAFDDPDAAVAGSLMPALGSFTPGEYLFDTSVGAGQDLGNTNVGTQASPAHVGRHNCHRAGCSNNNGEGFLRPSDLKRHQEKHEKRHKCSDCTRQFGSKADLDRHGREVHGIASENGKPSMHFCPEKSCKRSKRGFPRLWNMQQHYIKMHGGPVPSQFSSPATYSIDTPLVSSSGESAPTTPPSSLDEPHTPCAPSASNRGDQEILKKLIVSHLELLESKRQEGDREAQRLRALLRQMELESSE